MLLLKRGPPAGGCTMKQNAKKNGDKPLGNDKGRGVHAKVPQSLTLATQCRNVVTVWAPGWGCQAEVRYRKVARSRVGVEPTEPDTVRSRYRVLVGEVTVGVEGSEWWPGMRDDGKQLR